MQKCTTRFHQNCTHTCIRLTNTTNGVWQQNENFSAHWTWLLRKQINISHLFWGQHLQRHCKSIYSSERWMQLRMRTRRRRQRSGNYKPIFSISTDAICRKSRRDRETVIKGKRLPDIYWVFFYLWKLLIYCALQRITI